MLRVFKNMSNKHFFSPKKLFGLKTNQFEIWPIKIGLAQKQPIWSCARDNFNGFFFCGSTRPLVSKILMNM
jgi:hypothetical protein